MRRSLFANWIHYIAAKKPQPLCENWNEKGIGKNGIAATGYNAQYNTQGWNVGGEGVKWEDSGGGGGRAAPLCQLIYEPGEMVWQYT
jgi:hypothetical protein